jgi:20S proteasome subunit beta 5
MNIFVDKYSTTSAASQLRRAQRLAEEDDEFSDAAWGSEAGFGNIVKGAPSFNVPNVADVSFVSANAASDAILSDYL